ncbi:11293_t:CDS:2, partial [Gigaspora margarita]
TLKEVDIGVNQNDQKLDMIVQSINEVKQSTQKLNMIVQSIDLMQFKIDQFKHFKTDNLSSNIQVQRIDSNKLSSPYIFKVNNHIRDNGSVIKKFYGTIEVACKFVKNFKTFESELAILGKLSQSPYILGFYGFTNFDNCDFMVLDWAEYGTLRDVYSNYDILWTRKIKIIQNICCALVYLRSVNIFHHDLRCKNIFVRKDLEPKLGNFKSSKVTDGSKNLDLNRILVDVVHWMAPELLEKYQDQNTEKIMNKNIHFIVNFGMLIWELCYEKIPYEGWNIQKIFEHVSSGRREKLSCQKFKKEEDKKIQEEVIKIIEKSWQHVPYQRIEIANLYQKLEKLSEKYQVGLNEPLLEKNKTLDFEEDKDEPIFYKNSPVNPLFVEDKQLKSPVIMPTIIPLEEGIKNHKNMKHAKAWECIKENAEIGNKEAKFWKGYYLTYGYDIVTPDPVQAMELFKEAADYGHVEAQCRYAVLLLSNLRKDSDNEETKKEKCEEIIRYFKSAAGKKNADAMYYLGDIYFNRKLRIEKNEPLGLEYLKSAASLMNDKALLLLGDIYLNGKSGLEKNKQLGLDYLKSAAKLRNEKAISMLEGLKKKEVPLVNNI